MHSSASDGHLSTVTHNSGRASAPFLDAKNNSFIGNIQPQAYAGIFLEAIKILDTIDTDTAFDTINDLKQIEQRLGHFERMNLKGKETPSYVKYKQDLISAAYNLSDRLKHGTAQKQIEAGQHFLKTARANNTVWEKIGTLAIRIAGVAIIVGLLGIVCPVAALVALKLLSSGVFMNGIVPAATSILATTSGKIAIGTGLAASLYPLDKFRNWMSKPTPVQTAAKSLESRLERMSANF